MFAIKVEPQFQSDYRRVMRRYPHLKKDFAAAIDELAKHGFLSEQYRPHKLANPGGNYNDHIDFHLSDGEVDGLVLYVPHRSNPIIRLVRIGSHGELFQGPLR